MEENRIKQSPPHILDAMKSISRNQGGKVPVMEVIGMNGLKIGTYAEKRHKPAYYVLEETHKNDV